MKENTNEERKYIVYMHTSPSGKRYIGITCQNPPEKRWRNGHGYSGNEYFSRAILKYGWQNFIHEILFEGITQNEAEQKEVELIAYYKSNNKDFGYNQTNGGEATFGYKFSDEQKEKLSKAQKKRLKDKTNHPLFGKSHSDETRDKIRNGNKGHKHSKEHKNKISNSLKRPVLQYGLDGKFIKFYDGAIDAGIENNISPNNITLCCQGKIGYCKDYIFIYYNEAEEIKQYLDKIVETKNKPILQYTKEGIFLKKYDSVTQASKILGVGQSQINKCCRNKAKTAYGYIWRYASDIQNPVTPLFTSMLETTCGGEK